MRILLPFINRSHTADLPRLPKDPSPSQATLPGTTFRRSPQHPPPSHKISPPRPIRQ